MKNLTTAIYGKLPGSTLEGYIKERLYKGRAPDGATYPYIVYSLAEAYPEYTFSETFEWPTFQFDIFSTASGTTEIENIYTALTALYDDCALSPTDETVISMRRGTYNMISEQHTTISGVQQVWHYFVEYTIHMLRA